MGTSRLTIVVGRTGVAPPSNPYHHDVFSGPRVTEDTSPPSWPFRRAVTPSAPLATPCSIVIPDLHRAFPSGQTPGTRLVLTQSSYQLQRWLDWLEAHPDVQVLGFMEAASPGLAHEAFVRRGPWSRIDVREVTAGVDPYAPAGRKADQNSPLLASFLQPNPMERLAVTTRAIEDDPGNPALHLALSSVHMERQDLVAAHAALEHALGMAPDWEATHFEAGKLWLRKEEMEPAAAAFAEAARLMPSFAAAFSNLGAVLGELGRQDAALAALQQALRSDPHGYPVLNNLGALHRDAGRLDDAEAVFRQVVELAPEFVFGYYNLGQTLMMQGRISEARDAYETGMARDAQKTPRQAMRLAAVRAASGDPEGAVAAVTHALTGTPEAVRKGLLKEAENALMALSAMPGVSDADVSRVLEAVRRYSV